jgi:predicted Zn finger-like uncharacterized protein
MPENPMQVPSAMLVTCPSCRTKYRAPHGRIVPGRSRVRCTRCLYVFVPGGADCEPESPCGTAPEEFAAPQAEGSSGPGLGGAGSGDAPARIPSGRIAARGGPAAGRGKPSRFPAALLALVVATLAAAYSLHPRWMAVLPFPPLRGPDPQTAERAEPPGMPSQHGSLLQDPAGNAGADTAGRPGRAQAQAARGKTSKEGPSLADRDPGSGRGTDASAAANAPPSVSTRARPPHPAAGRNPEAALEISARTSESTDSVPFGIGRRAGAPHRTPEAAQTPSGPATEAGARQEPRDKPEIRRKPYAVVLSSCRKKASALHVIARYRTRSGAQLALGRVRLNESGAWWVVYLGRFATRRAAERARRSLGEDRRLMIETVPYANLVDTFDKPEARQRTRKRLERLGYVPYVGGREGQALLVGAHRTVARAQRMQKQLRGQGFETVIVER